MTTNTIICSDCGTRLDIDNVSPVEFGNITFDRGWRYRAVHDSFNCPKCVKKHKDIANAPFN